MKKIILFLLSCLLSLSLSLAWGFSTHKTEISRTFDIVSTSISDPVTVKVNFKNSESEGLRGFLYSEQIPEGLSVHTKSVKINGKAITDYIIETGVKNDVFNKYIPFRWILEEPLSLGKMNSIPAAADLEIIYTISSSRLGSYISHHFNWSGYYSNYPEGEKAAYGHSESNDKKTLTFVKSDIHAIDDNYTIETEGILKQDNPGGVLTNDSNPLDDTLTAQLDKDVSFGNLVLNSDGSFVYSHDGIETTTDKFSYYATNGTDKSNIATATIHILDLNSAPVANDDSVNTRIDTRMTINVLQNDTDTDGTIDPATIKIVKNPSSGTAEVNMDGTITYYPATNAEGKDLLTYTVKDNNGAVSNEASVIIALESRSENNGGGCFIKISLF